MEEVLIKIKHHSDFEKLLFANRLIKEQQQIITGQIVTIKKLKNSIKELEKPYYKAIGEYKKRINELEEILPSTTKQIHQRREIKRLTAENLSLKNKIQQIKKQ